VRDGEEELVVIGGQGVKLSGGADHIAPHICCLMRQTDPFLGRTTEDGFEIDSAGLKPLAILSSSNTIVGFAEVTARHENRSRV
jgi:hypothetical protein